MRGNSQSRDTARKVEKNVDTYRTETSNDVPTNVGYTRESKDATAPTASAISLVFDVAAAERTGGISEVVSCQRATEAVTDL